jgi:hypothetical protein
MQIAMVCFIIVFSRWSLDAAKGEFNGTPDISCYSAANDS